MTKIPEDLKYTSTHEWVRLEEDGVITVGITDHAQDLLGDVVYIELPDLEREMAQGEECAVIESVKAASDIYAPNSGEIIDINEQLLETPDLVNQDPYGAGWIFRIKVRDVCEQEKLLSPTQYAQQIATDPHH